LVGESAVVADRSAADMPDVRAYAPHLPSATPRPSLPAFQPVLSAVLQNNGIMYAVNISCLDALTPSLCAAAFRCSFWFLPGWCFNAFDVAFPAVPFNGRAGSPMLAGGDVPWDGRGNRNNVRSPFTLAHHLMPRYHPPCTCTSFLLPALYRSSGGYIGSWNMDDGLTVAASPPPRLAALARRCVRVMNNRT